jgi:demethylmenaquinone methyltransferase/2-methoxy-6-polyprenyl-1,4-benzoquinol methylase
LKDTALVGWKDKRKVMQSYDVTAEMYDERYGAEQQRKYKKALENVNAAGKAVLDVGCGSGLFFREVANQADMVVGVDVSRKLLQKAKEHAEGLRNVSVLQADADHLPFKNGFFDAVFAFTVLQNMPNPHETLNEVKRITKKGGRVVVTGLKKAFPLEKFMDVLEGSRLPVVAFVDDEAVNCYVAVLTV